MTSSESQPRTRAEEMLLDPDRLTAIIESRMSGDLAWLGDDGKTISRFDPEHVGWALAHLYQTGDVVSGLPPIEAEAAQDSRPQPIDRNALAYALATHLCYGAIQPDDKAIDVLLERYDSFTSEKEAQRQDDLAEAYAEYEANR